MAIEPVATLTLSVHSKHNLTLDAYFEGFTIYLAYPITSLTNNTWGSPEFERMLSEHSTYPSLFSGYCVLLWILFKELKYQSIVESLTFHLLL